MVTDRRYTTTELLPYIDWAYFFHAWGVPARSKEAQTLKAEGLLMLEALDADGLSAKGRVGLFKAGARGDDIVLESQESRVESQEARGKEREARGIIPCLRQQHAVDGGPNLCLADFVKPWSEQGAEDTVGVFATMADYDPDSHYGDDAYQRMMAQTLCDRMAEAAACRLHQEVRTTIWGYAADEQLTISDMIKEKNRGIRPAVGYPSLPDQSLNFVLDKLIGMSEMGIRLTENGAMRPHASVSGLMIAHPASRYFAIGPIDAQQMEDYAHRRGMSSEEIKKFLLR
ncbi:MAG: 5-methyltetrahydrofolate--homocysteine methyltransferase [Bacteroidaceae bacterium]|nr:5-methyltetrahydrofolate--homocysteine methyltransferase [Bacteroidaceae bacterium]